MGVSDLMPGVNEVVLCGRISTAPSERELPSGDACVTFRVAVPRAAAPVGGHQRPGAPTVDTIDCAAWRPSLRGKVLRWGPGDLVEVRGALRRRFWRGTGGLMSATEVEVGAVRRVSKGPDT